MCLLLQLQMACASTAYAVTLRVPTLYNHLGLGLWPAAHGVCTTVWLHLNKRHSKGICVEIIECVTLV